jgi:two-component system, cell cycle response regulator DivK
MTNSPLILLVDDFLDNLEMYAEWLSFQRYNVVVAHGGQEALDVARRDRPVLILLDLSMPGINGTDVLRTLRTDPTFDGVSIVAFTAHALEDERVSALLAGFDEVIPKPCLPDDLCAAINRLLAGGRQRQSA